MSEIRESVLIVGSVALDSVQTPRGKVDRALGGAAVYSGVAASFFAPVRVVGVVGEDFPQEHLDYLLSRGIDLRGIQVASGKTFYWAGSYEGSMDQAQTLTTELNVFQDFRPRLPEDYKSSKYVFLANIDPELQLEVLAQTPDTRLVGCDTMNYWITGKRDALLAVLKKVDVAFLNDAEAKMLVGESNLTTAARRIQELGPKYVVIKKGEHGALMYCGMDSCFAAASYPLPEVIDPTGAGDSFAGGFMGYMAAAGVVDEANMRKAVIYGSTLASFNVQDFSLERFRRLTNEEVNSRYEEFKRLMFFEGA